MISLTTSPIFCAASARPWTELLLRLASSTARLAMEEDCSTWRPISSIDLAISSAAAATVWTLPVACSEAAPTASD